MAKKKFYLVLDIEGAGLLDCAFAYDVGGAVVDKKGNLFHTFSFVVDEIFCQEKELMNSAYYAEKIPDYISGIVDGRFSVRTFYEVKKYIRDLLDYYNIAEVFAYNASYDMNGLNNTLRWVTKSKYRYFLPYGVKFNCIWNMACQVICTQKAYGVFCIENGFVSAKGNLQTSAEAVYSYVIGQKFQEKHTGLEDVLIESEILAHCFRQKKKMERNINRSCWRLAQPKKNKS